MPELPARDTPRIVIYARYSTDLQNPSSIDDQVLLCRDLAARTFDVDEITAIFGDASLSGATMARPGLSAMLAAAEAGQFDILVAEGLDRISRSLADIARIHEMLRHAGVRIWTGHEGEVGDLHVGFKGTMNALYLTDLRAKVARGLRAVAEAGRIPTSSPYGYRVVRGVVDERGQYVNGLREIDPEKGAIVRRIFEEAASGIPVRAIVRALNDEGIAAPGGGLWRTVTITGEGLRGKGIIPNEIYRGWLVFNRTKKVIDPVTGRRRYVVRPRHEHIRREVPELAIVDDATWRRAQVRRKIKSRPIKTQKIDRGAQAHQRPLTGLMRCGWCGGYKRIGQERRYICDTFRFSKKCKNARGTKESVIAAKVIAELRAAISAKRDWKAVIDAGLEKTRREKAALEAELKELEQRVNRLMEAIERGIGRAGPRILALENRIKEIRALPPLPPVISSEDVQRRLLLAVSAIEAALPDRKYTRPILGALELVINQIVLTPLPNQRAGESIDIQMNPGGWPEFYRHIHADWPKVGT